MVDMNTVIAGNILSLLKKQNKKPPAKHKSLRRGSCLFEVFFVPLRRVLTAELTVKFLSSILKKQR